VGKPADANALADLEALSLFAKGNDCADSFMARYEGKCGHAPFVIEHGEVGMTYSAVADLNLYFLGSEFTQIEAERLKRGMRLGSSVSMEGGGHLVALLNRELTIKEAVRLKNKVLGVLVMRSVIRVASAVKCHATRSVQPASEKENLGAVAGAKFHERIFEFNRPADLIRSRI